MLLQATTSRLNNDSGDFEVRSLQWSMHYWQCTYYIPLALSLYFNHYTIQFLLPSFFIYFLERGYLRPLHVDAHKHIHCEVIIQKFTRKKDKTQV
jgi:hypothetical protein